MYTKPEKKLMDYEQFQNYKTPNYMDKKSVASFARRFNLAKMANLKQVKIPHNV